MIAPGPLGIENAILDRLESELGPEISVASGGALSAQGIEPGTLIPIAVVEPIETGVFDATSRATQIIEEQRWSVALYMRHLADPERLRVDYSEIDPVILATIAGLTGWQPPTGVRELRYQGRDDFLHEPGVISIGIEFLTLYHLKATTTG